MATTRSVFAEMSAIMHRRHLLLLSAALLLPANNVLAAEAAPLAASIGVQTRGSLEARLNSQGYAVLGETRRKGDFIILTASRSNAPWRLVIDGRTGEIVGQKPLSSGPALD